MPSISTTLSALAVATGAEGDDDDEIDDCCICCAVGHRSSHAAYAKVRQSEDGDADASYQGDRDANSGTSSAGSIQIAPSTGSSGTNNGRGSGNDVQRRPIHLHSAGNRGIAVSYFLIGFGPALLGTPLSIYMVKTLDAAPAQQNTIGVLMTLPWTFKVVYGFISDAFPIFGMRRKPYFILGWLVSVLTSSALAAVATPTLNQLSGLLLLSTTGSILADVMSDAMVVERQKFEPENVRGAFQSTCYSVRFCGSILGSIGGTVLYNNDCNRGFIAGKGVVGDDATARASCSSHWGLSFGAINWLVVCLSTLGLALTAPSLEDSRGVTVKPVSEQFDVLWRTVQKKAVWLPMCFIYLYNAMQWGNVAWSSFLQDSLGFKAERLGMLSVAANIMTLGGVLVFKKFFLKTSLRTIYVWTTVIPVTFSVLQLLLIFRINLEWGISDFAFSMGDNVIAQLVGSILFLPVCILFASLCPDGSEGCVYAMLTSFSNVAMLVASSLSNIVSHIWDVSNGTLKRHDYGGLWRLTVFTSLICCVPLLFMRCMLPTTRRLKHLKSNEDESNPIAGRVFIIVLASSICFSIYNSLHELGWI